MPAPSRPASVDSPETASFIFSSSKAQRQLVEQVERSPVDAGSLEPPR